MKRTIEFVLTVDGSIHAIFRLDGDIVDLRFARVDNDSQTIRDWLLDGQIKG